MFSASTPMPPARQSAAKPLPAAWLLALAGLLALYLPTFYDALQEVWGREEQAHGPIILGVSLWLLYRNWPAMLAAAPGDSAQARAAASVWGWPVLALGLLSYLLGRVLNIQVIEMFSFPCTVVAVLLLLQGPAALKVQWFPLFFMLFMLPLPGPFVDTVTMPMKMAVSWCAEHILFAVGYPIARSGVVLQVGQYQLLVADACAGLHTLFTLEALGLLYLNIVRHASFLRNVGLALLIVPISFTANIIRVITLTLITYHFGDAAGQGFLHGFAGMVLFISALLLIIGVDTLLRGAVRSRSGRAQNRSAT
ncbi:exosortase B [Massilia sp. Root351]|jgi:exosortase B|uniref:exosortase B n=1 Tax=Massilia sp. Root351 TaxID=1736522 RepID=UPI00070923EA|nr:exosortase B [Massilia sp. Root351]KQV78455.1 exosortase B [Massilia sp. Root351]